MTKTWAIVAIVAYVSLCFVGITALAHENITTQQAKDTIDGNDPPFLLDVWEIAEATMLRTSLMTTSVRMT